MGSIRTHLLTPSDCELGCCSSFERWPRDPAISIVRGETTERERCMPALKSFGFMRVLRRTSSVTSSSTRSCSRTDDLGTLDMSFAALQVNFTQDVLESGIQTLQHVRDEQGRFLRLGSAR